MKYRFYALMSLLALGVGSLVAQDYDDIYYDASKSSSSKAKTTKVVTPAKTVAVYGEVPEKYKEAVQVNYSTDRDVDEYNRRGAYEPNYEVTLTGDTIYYDNDTIYEEAFANTRRIERFYNPDVVILSDDDDLVELYYSESPTVNLIIGSDWGYGSYFDYGWSSYYPWYTGRYYPWRGGWSSPWYYSWYSPFWGWDHWYWGYTPWYYSSWYWGWHRPHWGWDHWAWSSAYTPYRHNPSRFVDTSSRPGGHRTGLAPNRNERGRVDARAGSRNNVSPRGASSRSAAIGNMGSRSASRGSGTVGSRSSGNMGSRSSSGVTTRRSSSASVYSSGSSNRTYGGSRSSGSYSSGRSSSSSSSGSTYRSSGSSSSSSRSSGGSYSSGGGSRGGSSGGGSHGGSSGGSRRH